MATKAEIEYWIRVAQHKIDKYRSTVKDCNQKIDRLKPVYEALGEAKDEFRSARKSTERIFEEKGTWRGEKNTAFRAAGEGLDSACGTYYNTLDAAQDAVNEKIGELRAKKDELTPLIGKLKAQISQLWVDFQNATN